MSKMTSPFEGRLTMKWRGYAGHAGMDIAPPKPGQTGRPVYAAFAGTVKKVHTTAKHGNRYSTWAVGRTGNGCLIANPDGEGNGYNHMRPVVQAGQTVKAGQLIGHNDTSGNQSGPHLHFEMWANWRDAGSDYDPQLCFNKYGVRAGSKPTGTTTPTASPSKRPADYDPKVKAYQDAQVYYPGMKKDGVDGPMNRAHKAWVKRYQKALNLWESCSPKLLPDGSYGTLTDRETRQVMEANNDTGGTYRGVIEKPHPIPGRMMCKMLGIPTHPSA